MTILRLNKLNTAPLHEQVYQEILFALMSGQFEPGQKLTSRTIAAELGTSDMPVRSALMRLQALHALSALPNGVMEVPLMGRERFAQITNTRFLLEEEAARKAVPHIKGKILDTVKHHSKLLADAAKSKDISQYLLKNYQFKFSIYKHCNNDSLYFMIETLWLQIGPFLRNLVGSVKADFSGIFEIDYHTEIVEAIQAQDSDRAASLLKQDIKEGADYLFNHAPFHDENA